jgi:GTPase
MHKSAFVNIIGNPNVGKSTLMNRIMGEKFSIISPKAQTTRHRIMGMINTDDYQLVFSDTPGILVPKYKLHESMMKFVQEALVDADILILVTDIFETPETYEDILKKISSMDAPLLLLINKVDLVKDNQKLTDLIEAWKSIIPRAEVLIISALEGFNTDHIISRIVELAPEGPVYFPKDEISDKPVRFFISEIIREKIFLSFKKEVPYACEILVEEFKEEESIIRIRAVIVVERESQKPILIGKGGIKLKYIGSDARKDMEKFLGKKVFLEMFVKVDKDWRTNESKLKRYGY